MKDSGKSRKEALQKIINFFTEAGKNPDSADIYVKKARKTGMKVNLPIPKPLKKKYCKHCYSYFKSGNYRVRTRNGMLVYYCLMCKKYMRSKIS